MVEGKINFDQSNNAETLKDVFARRLNEGFEQYAFGSGPWVATPDNLLVDGGKISALYAFFKPDPVANVATYQRGAIKDLMGNTQVGGFEDRIYTPEEFQQTIEKYQIALAERKPLA